MIEIIITCFQTAHKTQIRKQNKQMKEKEELHTKKLLRFKLQ